MAKPPPRLFVEDNLGESLNVNLGNTHAHYLKNVLRLKASAAVALFNGRDGEWHGTLNLIRKSRVTVNLVEMVSPQPNSVGPTLMFAPVKRVPMEIMIQKATELGVRKITPIISDRTEVKDLNFERANKIIIEATEQSNQLNTPDLGQIIKLKDFINNISKDKKLFFADVNSKHKLSSKDLGQGKKASVLIGPEGDFSPAERELILSKPETVSFTLSKNILRADTAAISAISIINFIHNKH